VPERLVQTLLFLGKHKILEGHSIDADILMTIPKTIEARILFDNDHTCCICNQVGKDVHIHHIDGDDQNNVPPNLAVLCLECHSKATGSRGFGRKYSPLEVQKYKQNWELVVSRRRKLLVQHTSLGTSKWVEIETARIVYEFAVTRDIERANEIFELLDMYYIFEGNSSFALDRLHDVVPFVSSPKKSALMAEHVLHYSWHLPGPEDVKIKGKDIKDLHRAIRVLEWIGTFEAMSRRAAGPINASLDSLAGISTMANLYGQRKLQDAALKAINAIRKEASESMGDSDAAMAPLVTKADEIITKLARVSRPTQPGK
jgi:hypothetical protein